MPIPQTLDEARELIAPPEHYDTALRLYLDEEEADLDEDWKGPLPSQNQGNAADVRSRIERSISTRALVQEGVDGHADAVIGLDPLFAFVPAEVEVEESDDETTDPLDPDAGESDEEDELTALGRAITEASTDWWDDAGMQAVMHRAVALGNLGGTSALRPVWEFKDSEDASAALTADDFAEGLARITFEAFGANECYFGRDSETLLPFSVLVFEVTGDDGSPVTVGEISWVADDGLTYLKFIDGDGQETESTGLDLGGELWHIPVNVRTLITKSIIRQQQDWTLAATLECMNLEHAGFRQRDFLNIMPPGRWREDPNAPTGRVFEPDPTAGLATGPGAHNFLYAVASRNAEGEMEYQNASVVVSEPIDPETLQKTQNRAEEALLSMTKQRHRLISGEAVVSGESRIQARQDFAVSLNPTAKGTRKALRRALWFSVKIAGLASGDAMLLEGLKLDVTVQVYTGPLTSEEREQIRAEFRDGILSLETAMSRLGVEDPQAEIARLREQALFNATLMQTRIQNMATLYSTGMELQVAAVIAQLPAEVISALDAVGGPVPTVQQ